MIRPAAVAAAGLIALAGCARTEVPRDHFYRLSVPDPTRVHEAPVLDGTVVVGRFLADGLFGERALVWSRASSPHTLRQYRYHFWTEPPGHMLQEATVAVLRAANAARRVATPEMRARADYRLTGKLKRLEQRLGEEPRAVVEVEIGISRERDGRLVWLRELRAERAAVGPGVDAAVAAFAEALAAVYEEMLAGLGEG